MEALSDETQRESAPGPSSVEEAIDGDVPLIGQLEAATKLSQSIERAFNESDAALVFLEGGRGSGKTRLLVHASELAVRMAPTVRVLYAAVRDGGRDGSYAPFSRLLLERFGITPSSAPSAVRGKMATEVSITLATKDAIEIGETTHLLGHVAGVPFPDSPFLTPLKGAPADLRARASRAIRSLVEGDATKAPLLVLLDDMHHAEEDGWDLLSALADVSGRVAIILAGSDEAARKSLALGAETVHIQPLKESDVAGLVLALVPRLVEAPEPLVTLLTHRSKGNPSAIREELFALVESGLLIETDDGLAVDQAKLESGALPVTMEDVIEARLARLTAPERATLDRAAVVGEVFWDGPLLGQMRSESQALGDDADPATVWPNDDDQEALHEVLVRLEEKGFILHIEGSDLPGTREYSFQHGPTRTLLYDRMDEALRTRRHAAVARWLMVLAEIRREGVAAMIAPHLEKAGQPARAGRAYLEAAGYARQELRTTMALRFVEKAIPLIAPDDLVRKLNALHEHGSLLTTVGRYDDAIASFTQMLRLAWTMGARGKGGAALNRIGRVHRQRGEDVKARTMFERALTLFRAAGDVRGVASTLDDLAQILRVRGQTDEALVAANEALEIRKGHGDARGQATSLQTLGTLELSRGNLATAESCFKSALAMRQESSDHEGTMQSHNALGVLAYDRGDLDGAIVAWRSALALANEIADRRSECFLLNNLGEALTSQGEHDEAREALLRARKLAATLRDRRAAAEIERNIGLLALRCGEESAKEHLERAFQFAVEYGGKEAIGLAHRAMGKLRSQTLFGGSGDEGGGAEESFLASIQVLREIGHEKEAARSIAELGYYLLERGQRGRARERLAEAVQIMRRIGLAESSRVERTLSELS